MSHSFVVLETTSSPLWDFGWFDRTRFRAIERQHDARGLLGALIQSPLYSRSFCTSPDPWGEGEGDHGPIALAALSIDAFIPVTHAELEERIRVALGRPDFSEPPSPDQTLPVYRWVQEASRPGVDLFALDAPPAASGKLANMGIWLLFHEFVAVDQANGEVSVVVIGYD